MEGIRWTESPLGRERERERQSTMARIFGCRPAKTLAVGVEASWNLYPKRDGNEVDSLTAYHLTNSISDGPKILSSNFTL